MKHALVIGPFALFLWLPALAGLLGAEAGRSETREPAVPPDWTLGSWLDADAYAAAGRWLSDALPVRSQAIALDSWIDYRLLGDSPTEEVLVGADRELFLTDTLRWPCQPNAAPERIVAVLTKLARPLARRGTDLIVLLSPNKAFLYSERLPVVGAHLNECAAAARRKLRKLLAKSNPFTAVDVWTPFEAEHRGGRRLFPRLDRHWEDYAGVVQTRALVEAIVPGIWDEGAVVAGDLESRSAELPARFMNLRIPQAYAGFRVERVGIEAEVTEVPVSASSNHRVRRVRTTSETLPLIPGRTLVVVDSFGLGHGNSFAAFPEEATYILWDLLLSDPRNVASLFLEVDRVVLQVVEDRPGVVFGSALARLTEVLVSRGRR